MKLFLAAEIGEQPNWQNLESFIGGFSGKRCLYLPNPTYVDEVTLNLFLQSGMTIEILYLEQLSSESNIEQKFLQADVIFVAGGMVGCMAYWMLRHNADIFIKEAVAKGSVYVGSSGGSMICARNLSVAEWFIGETERGASYVPGLGLVDFDFYPHYREELLQEIKKNYTGNKMYLVKNNEAIVVNEATISILGEERVLFKDNVSQKVDTITVI